MTTTELINGLQKHITEWSQKDLTSKRLKSGEQYIFFDKFNANYAVKIKLFNKLEIYKRFDHLRDAINYRNKMLKRLIEQAKTQIDHLTNGQQVEPKKNGPISYADYKRQQAGGQPEKSMAAIQRSRRQRKTRKPYQIIKAAKSNNKLGERYIYKRGDYFIVEIRKFGTKQVAFGKLDLAKAWRDLVIATKQVIIPSKTDRGL